MFGLHFSRTLQARIFHETASNFPVVNSRQRMAKLTAQHLSIIRSYLRHLTRFPDPITRAYLLNLLHQRCRRPHGSDPERVQKRVEKTRHFIESIRLKIAAANSGHVNVFEDLLREAFARTGKRREELMKSYMETGVANSKDLPYPSCKFPTYPPALVALLLSPEANPAKGRPTMSDLQSIPPSTLITNTWSDLPPKSQIITPPKAAHMGMLQEARQINHRRWLRDRWLAGLVGPPLSAPPELENCLPPNLVKLSQSMLSEINKQVNHRQTPWPPRFSPRSNQQPRSQYKNLNSKQQPPILRIPAKLPPSHPLFPSNYHQDLDPLNEILPKRSRPTPPSPLDLSRGPRRITPRFIRRRYQNVLGEIPIIYDEEKKNNDVVESLNNQSSSSHKKLNKKTVLKKKTELILDDSDGKYVDRNWITPDSDESGDNKSYSVKKAGPGLGSIKFIEMSAEDSNWMP